MLERLSKFDEELTYPNKARLSDPHELYYYPGRIFRVGKARFYGLKDFWGGTAEQESSLETVQGNAEELYSTLTRIGLKRPDNQPIRKLTGAISVFEDSEWGKRIYEILPKDWDIPEEALELLEYASRADGREWVSNHQIGGWQENEIWDYDIRSCYPSVACTLPDMRGMTYWKSSRLGDKELNAQFGIVYGALHLDPASEYAHCSPIVADIEELQQQGNPLGHLPPDYFTIDDIRFVINNSLGTFKISSGWFVSGEVTGYPYRPIMEQLYQMREEAPTELWSQCLKEIANALIGKMRETRITGGLGKIRNDLYHATVLSRARIKVAQFLIDNKVQPEELLAIQTDGVKLTRDIRLPDNGMGTWINKGTSPTMIAGPYNILSRNTRPHRMTYADLEKMVKEHPGQQQYGLKVKHRITMVQAIRNYNDLSRTGEVIDLPTSIDLVTLNEQQNRHYTRLPRTGRQLLNNQYSSSPIVL